MKDKLEIRLNVLRAEYESGANLSAELEARQASTRNTMLRISGAIQVLEELLKEEHVREGEADHSANGAAPVTAPVG